jgi:hypothetical protein
MATKAENLTFPMRLGHTDNTPVAYFACSSADAALLIPATFYGKFVILTNDSANTAQFFISDDSASTCDETLTASTPRLGATLGGVILGNASRQGRLPYSADNSKSYYLVCSSVAAATLRMELAEQ